MCWKAWANNRAAPRGPRVWTMNPAATEVTSSSRAPTISPDLRMGATSCTRAERGCPPRGAICGTLKHTYGARPAPVHRPKRGRQVRGAAALLEHDDGAGAVRAPRHQRRGPGAITFPNAYGALYSGGPTAGANRGGPDAGDGRGSTAGVDRGRTREGSRMGRHASPATLPAAVPNPSRRPPRASVSPRPLCTSGARAWKTPGVSGGKPPVARGLKLLQTGKR